MLTCHRHLRRLIAIHGRYSYLRNTGVILYSFYKSALVRRLRALSTYICTDLTFTLPLIYFSFFSGFSGQVHNNISLRAFCLVLITTTTKQTMYDQWVITFFNIAFASLPPLIYGFFEKDIPEAVRGI